jgi:hypothetical protein
MGFAGWAEALLAGDVVAFVFPPVPPGVQTHRLAMMDRIVEGRRNTTERHRGV